MQLSMGGSLPGRRPAPGHPVQPGEQIAKALESSLLVGPHAATCDAASSREDSGFVLFFFPPHGPYLCLSPLGVSYQTTVGLELKSQTLATEAALEVAGLCREGLGRPVLFSGRRAAPEGYNSLEGIWLFLFTRRLACPLSPSVHFWDSSLQNSTGAQSSKYKGSRQRKQICPKAHN